MFNITVGCNNESVRVELDQYLQLLRERGILKSKFTPYLDAVSSYVDEGSVYKVMFIAYKDVKKIGLDKYMLIKNNLPKNKLISPPKFNIESGRHIIQYVYRTQKYNRFEDESKVYL